MLPRKDLFLRPRDAVACDIIFWYTVCNGAAFETTESINCNKLRTAEISGGGYGGRQRMHRSRSQRRADCCA